MTEKFELNPLNSGSTLPIELKTNSTALTDLVDDLFGERIYLTHVASMRLLLSLREKPGLPPHCWVTRYRTDFTS